MTEQVQKFCRCKYLILSKLQHACQSVPALKKDKSFREYSESEIKQHIDELEQEGRIVGRKSKGRQITNLVYELRGDRHQ